MSLQTLKRKPIGLKAKFNFFINNWLIPITNRFNKQTHMSVIRNSFAALMPLILAGAFAIFVNQILLGNTRISLAYWIAIWSGYEQKDVLIFTGIAGDLINGFKIVGTIIYKCTYSLLALYIAFLIGYFLAKKRKQQAAIITGLITLITFLISGGIFAITDLPYDINGEFLGAEGLFAAIIIAFLTGELFLWIMRNNWLAIKMPQGYSKIVKQSFASLIPMILIIFLFVIVSQIFISLTIQQTVIKVFTEMFVFENTRTSIKTIVRDPSGGIFYGTFLWENNMWQETTLIALTKQQISLLGKIEFLTFTGQGQNMWSQFNFLQGEYSWSLLNVDFRPLNLVALIYRFFTYPFMSLISNVHVGLGIAILYVLFSQLFWFIGVHGTNIMNGLFSPIWIYALAQNTTAVLLGNPPIYLFNEAFFIGFIFLGGWGMSLALLIVTLIVGRERKARIISKATVTQAIFNINGATYCYPLMLNPIMFIPAVFGPVLLVVWTWTWMVTGYVPYASIRIPWIAPTGIGAFMTTVSWKGVLLALSNLFLAMLMYLPFVLIANKVAKNNNQSVKLKYLGILHYFFTGKNFQDERYQEIKLRHFKEHQVLRENNTSSDERNRLREKHIHEWIVYEQFLKKERKRLALEKKANKIEVRQKAHEKKIILKTEAKERKVKQKEESRIQKELAVSNKSAIQATKKVKQRNVKKQIKQAKTLKKQTRKRKE